LKVQLNTSNFDRVVSKLYPQGWFREQDKNS
jgi:hypothetical protein